MKPYPPITFTWSERDEEYRLSPRSRRALQARVDDIAGAGLVEAMDGLCDVRYFAHIEQYLLQRRFRVKLPAWQERRKGI